MVDSLREALSVVYRSWYEIEKQLEEILRLIWKVRYSMPALARFLRISIPTVSQGVTANCERGRDELADTQADRWRNVISGTKGLHQRKYDYSHDESLDTERESLLRPPTLKEVADVSISGMVTVLANSSIPDPDDEVCNPQKRISFR